MFRPASVVVLLLALLLAARPALAAEAFVDSSAWWVQATAENAPEKFHLLPDDSETPRDWIGLARDTGFLLTYQIIGIGILYVLPSSVSKWSESAKENIGFERWWDNVNNPVWDDDHWAVNYIGHSYFGATYYIRARERGFDRIDSFLYSALASALYEFGVEAIFERPSYNDLIVTPVGGALLGGFVFEPVRSWIRRKPELKWYDHLALIATDPIGALNYMAERLIGIKSDIRVGIPRRGGFHVELRLPLH
ncbi:MAG: DUF3943 domain-containing protein [Candidatus Rokuibacteriota bacterium]